jgi:hypothetical protein
MNSRVGSHVNNPSVQCTESNSILANHRLLTTIPTFEKIIFNITKAKCPQTPTAANDFSSLLRPCSIQPMAPNFATHTRIYSVTSQKHTHAAIVGLQLGYCGKQQYLPQLKLLARELSTWKISI